MSRKDSGSVLLAAVIILAVGLLALVGGVYWNSSQQAKVGSITDFASCKADVGSRIQESYPETCVTSDNRSFTNPDQQAPVAMKSVTTVYEGHKLTLKYPETWKRDTSGNGVITSPDKNVSVHYSLTPPSGIGGICGDEAEVMDPIVSLEWEEIPGISKALLVSRVTHFLKNGESPEFYQYKLEAVRNKSNVKNAKAGESACPIFIFANLIGLDKVDKIDGPTLFLSVSFKQLESADEGLEAVKAIAASQDAIAARAIIKTAVLK